MRIGNDAAVNLNGITMELQNGKVECAQNSQLLVARTSKLIMNNTNVFALSNGQMWRGVQVWGDATQAKPINPMATTYPHGYLKLQNCIIANALDAIRFQTRRDYVEHCNLFV